MLLWSSKIGDDRRTQYRLSTTGSGVSADIHDQRVSMAPRTIAPCAGTVGTWSTPPEMIQLEGPLDRIALPIDHNETLASGNADVGNVAPRKPSTKWTLPLPYSSKAE